MNEEFSGMKIVRDPYCPQDQVFFINENYLLMWRPEPKRTRRQRLVAWLKRRLKKRSR